MQYSTRKAAGKAVKEQAVQQALPTGAGKFSDPYAGRPLHLSGQMAGKVRDSFGIDVGQLALRESPEVAELGAAATTQGNAIRFAPGRFRPDTDAGRQVLGHELAHVAQQAGGGVQANQPGTNVHFGNQSEAAGDSAGQAFTSGSLAGAQPVPVAQGAAQSAPVQGLFEGAGSSIKATLKGLFTKENIKKGLSFGGRLLGKLFGGGGGGAAPQAEAQPAQAGPAQAPEEEPAAEPDKAEPAQALEQAEPAAGKRKLGKNIKATMRKLAAAGVEGIPPEAFEDDEEETTAENTAEEPAETTDETAADETTAEEPAAEEPAAEEEATEEAPAQEPSTKQKIFGFVKEIAGKGLSMLMGGGDKAEAAGGGGDAGDSPMPETLGDFIKMLIQMLASKGQAAEPAEEEPEAEPEAEQETPAEEIAEEPAGDTAAEEEAEGGEATAEEAGGTQQAANAPKAAAKAPAAPANASAGGAGGQSTLGKIWSFVKPLAAKGMNYLADKLEGPKEEPPAAAPAPAAEPAAEEPAPAEQPAGGKRQLGKNIKATMRKLHAAGLEGVPPEAFEDDEGPAPETAPTGEKTTAPAAEAEAEPAGKPSRWQRFKNKARGLSVKALRGLSGLLSS